MVERRQHLQNKMFQKEHPLLIEMTHDCIYYQEKGRLSYPETDVWRCGTGTQLSNSAQVRGTAQKTNVLCQDYSWASALRETEIKAITQTSYHACGNRIDLDTIRPFWNNIQAFHWDIFISDIY